MSQVTSKLSRKGQVTIPIEVRRRLGLRPSDHVSFVFQNDVVVLRRTESVVARTAGIIRSHRPPVTAEEERAAFEEAVGLEQAAS